MNALKLIFGLAMAVAVFWTFKAPDAMEFQRPELARIFFTHFPAAITTSLFLFIAPFFAVRYLISKDLRMDVRAVAANEIGFLFGLITMATGILFSRAQWGAWWQWDPRQTSFLLVLLLYMAYFALRAAFSDEVRRASSSASYAAFTALPALFLIFVFPRLPQVGTFHPNQTVTGGLLKGEYRYVTLVMLVLFVIQAVWLFRLRVRAGDLEIKLEESDGSMETGDGRPAPTGVVRPVSLSRQD